MKQKIGSINILLIVQGWYYLLTGIWPLIHIESFMFVTGPKIEVWLVKTLGVLITMVGTGFLIEAFYTEKSKSMVILAILCAIGFILVDTYYVYEDIISPVYLLDAAAQFILLLCWAVILIRNRA